MSQIIYELPSIVERIDPGRLFVEEQALEVELGSGDGSFLINWAKLHPQRNFIGIERLLGRIRKIERGGGRAGLRNLRAVRIEATYFLEFLLPRRACSAIHVYFPDPWPKRRHERHRTINSRFPALAREVLERGGRVYLRTDAPEYFRQMEEVFARARFFAAVTTPSELEEVKTDFEAEFNDRGIPTLRAAFELLE